MESETKKNSILPQILSDDLVEQILLRLPVRSLSRFKCVCKSWLSIISDPQFAKSHFDLAAVPTHRVFLYLSNNSKLNSVDIDTAISHDSAQAVFNNPLPSPLPQFPFSLHVVGSCRGFVLLTNTYLSEISYSRSTELGRNIDFVIWNPSTGFQKIVNTVYHSFPHLYGIGYDSSTDDYVVVIITMPWRTNGQFLFNTMVHCLSLRTNSWTRVVGTVTNDHLGLVSGEMHEFRHGSLLNGALHWLVESIHNERVIVAFDVMEKSLTEIPVPSELTLASQFKIFHLRVMGECLCLCFAGRGTIMPEIWVMKDYKVQSSWTKMFVQLPNNDPVLGHFFPICFTENGEILGSNGLNVVVRFNDKGELLQNRAIGQEMNIYRSIHNGMYRESLLSLPFDEATEEEATEEEHQI